jgi:enterochelin esterase family protein
VEGSPIFEPVEGDPGSLRATFVWHGEAERAAVVGGIAGGTFSENLMERDDTGTWRRSYVVPRAVRTTYGFLPDPPDTLEWGPELFYAIQPDPLNPATFVFPGEEEDPGFEEDAVRSLLEGPDAPSLAIADERPGVARGSLRVERFRSAVLGNERRVWLYAPPTEPAGLLVVFDGQAYTTMVPTPTILDNLLADGSIVPLAAVLIDSLDGETRTRELGNNDGFVEFLTDELLPWGRAELGVTDDPARTIVAGSSAGGLAAAFAAYRRPDVFGNVLSQSGAYWWGRDDEDEWLTHRLAEAGRLPLRFWLDAGVLETMRPAHRSDAKSILEANRALRDVLVDAGHEVHYAEFCGGHDYVCWRGTLADGLRALHGRAS